MRVVASCSSPVFCNAAILAAYQQDAGGTIRMGKRAVEILESIESPNAKVAREWRDYLKSKLGG